MNYTKWPWKIRTTVDESGDYPFPTYDIIAVHEWGPEGIGTAYQNPNNARMFAAAPELLEALQYCTTWMEATRASGDSGFWEWSEGDIYSNAMKTIAKALGK